MNGEADYGAQLVERFTTHHRRSHVHETGVGDALVGARSRLPQARRIPIADAMEHRC